MKTPRFTLPSLLVVGVLVLSGCADGSQGPDAPQTPSAPEPSEPWPTAAPPEDPQQWIADRRAEQADGAAPASAPASEDADLALDLSLGDPVGTTYREDAAGISFEATELADERLSAENPDLVRLLGSLERPTLRFGGNSTDRRFFFTAHDEPVPTDWPLEDGEEITRVTPEDLERVARLAEEVDADVIVSADLGHADPHRAGELAQHAQAAFGERLAGVMIGNEPNGFPDIPQNPVPIRDEDWGTEEYVDEAQDAVDAVREAAPGVVVVVPGAYDAAWWEAATETELTEPPGHSALAMHQYPLPECGDPDGDAHRPEQEPTVENITSPGTRERVDDLVAEASATARQASMPLWITETSASSCAGSNEITETLAAGVYSADYLLRAQQLGAQKVAFHSSLAPCRGGAPMSLLCSSGTFQTPGAAFVPRTNGLALALTGSLPGGAFLEVDQSTADGRADGARGTRSTAYAIRHDDGSLSVAVMDFRDPGEQPRPVELSVPGRPERASVSSLSGPGWTQHYPETALFDDADPDGSSTDDPTRPATQDEDDVALDAEAAARPVADRHASVDGFGLPLLPQDDAAAEVRAGEDGSVVTFSVPAGSASVVRIPAV
ncbi:cellulase family glycosylhydrolase [Kocuria palustris]|uniref:cellulase family glycosylhydrolase n=1 Tax=Kocuria palustris TaxID=71999 RepID=UPI0011A04BC9|nr:cellulase family glycosylhydrolase [Kocuria palustris]